MRQIGQHQVRLAQKVAWNIVDKLLLHCNTMRIEILAPAAQLSRRLNPNHARRARLGPELAVDNAPLVPLLDTATVDARPKSSEPGIFWSS